MNGASASLRTGGKDGEGTALDLIRRGWTQGQVAGCLGYSRRRVNRVERGLAEFSLLELELLANGLGGAGGSDH